ncbi:MAG: hypothetical protein ACU0EX_10870 [Sulfitobacter sp.]
MATLPKMLELIQPFDGRDEGTLLQFGRVLREAGYIPAGKRGKGAPDLGLEHAANLLLGTYGAASPKDGPKAVANLRTLEPWGGVEGHFHEKCEVFQDIMEKETFGEAIEELILGVPEIATAIVRIMDPDCTLSPEDEAEWQSKAARGMGPADVKVRLYPTRAAILVMQGERPLWECNYMFNDDRMSEYNDVMNADRKTITEFSIKTLSAYFAALMEGVAS